MKHRKQQTKIKLWNTYSHQNLHTRNMGQARQPVTTFETLYKFTPHSARTSATHTTTSKQHLQNGLDVNWNHEGMPFKKGKATSLAKSSQITII